MEKLKNVKDYLQNRLNQEIAKYPLALKFGPELIIQTLLNLDSIKDNQPFEIISSSLSYALLTYGHTKFDFLRELIKRGKTDDLVEEIQGYIDILILFVCICILRANHSSFFEGNQILEKNLEELAFPEDIRERCRYHFSSVLMVALNIINDQDLLDGRDLLTNLGKTILSIRVASGEVLTPAYQTGMRTAIDSYCLYFGLLKDLAPLLN